MSMFEEPYALGPNWLLERAGTTGGAIRTWRVLREDTRGRIPVAYINELPAKPRESSRFVATDLQGQPLGREHKTGPRGAPLDDVKHHKS